MNSERRRLETFSASGDFLAPSPVGLIYDGHDPIFSFKPLLETVSLPAIRRHDPHPTAATLVLLAGVHVRIVSEMLGQATIVVALDNDAHLLLDMGKNLANTMNQLGISVS